MSHRLCAVSSDYCSVCQNGLLPSAAATASNPLWPLAAPFLMTNCQPAPTKARLKCQHRMTKGPRGSSETNCVQYELILYSRAGAWLAAGCSGCWLASERMQGRGWPCRPRCLGPVGAGLCGEEEPNRGFRDPQWSFHHGGEAAKGSSCEPGMWDGGRCAHSDPRFCPICSQHHFRDNKSSHENTQAVENHFSQRNGCAENAVGTT